MRAGVGCAPLVMFNIAALCVLIFFALSGGLLFPVSCGAENRTICEAELSQQVRFAGLTMLVAIVVNGVFIL